MSNFLSVVTILSGSILLIGFLAILLNRWFQSKNQHGDSVSTTDVKIPDSECCGAHEVCEKESLLSAASKTIEYYDDEELDRFKGYVSNEYNTNEVAEFSDVFYTLQPTDVPGWIRSLQLREIELPDSLKDEVILVVSERRSH